jgi:hypothetical protein
VSVLDQDILSDVQSLVAEPLDGGASWPSGMWTTAEVLSELNTRQQELLRDSGMVLTRTTVGCVPHLLRHELPDDTIALQRVAWVRASDGRVFVLDRADEWELDTSHSTWRSEPGVPALYTDADVPTRVIRIAPAASVVGTLRLTYLAVPTAFSGAGVAATIPDDTTVGLVWGTLADLLSKEGRARDAARAQIAEQRATLVLEVVKLILQGWEA